MPHFKRRRNPGDEGSRRGEQLAAARRIELPPPPSTLTNGQWLVALGLELLIPRLPAILWAAAWIVVLVQLADSADSASVATILASIAARTWARFGE